MSRTRVNSHTPFSDHGTWTHKVIYKGLFAGKAPVVKTYADYAVAGGYLHSESCVDDLSPNYPDELTDHRLTIEKRSLEPLRVNGGRSISNRYDDTYKLFNDCGVSNLCNASHVGTSVLADIFLDPKRDMSQVVLECIAHFNPGSADVDVLNFLFELREFPAMLKQLGDLLKGGRAPSLGEGYLTYNFGWAPLIGDLQKLLKFQELVEKRLAYLNQIAQGTKIKRTLRETSATGTSYSSWVDSSLLWENQYERKDRIWYAVTLSSDVLHNLSQGEMMELAKSLAFNRRLKPSTIWNAIPWSWLIDWFTNIGSYIEIIENSQLFTWTRLNTMYTCDGTQHGSIIGLKPDYIALGYKWSGVGRYNAQATLKLREVTSTLPAKIFRFGIITDYQASILSALFAARFTKRA